MEKDNPRRILMYVGVLAAMFLVLFSLDMIFGLHYAPNEHYLNQVAEYEAAHPEVKQVKTESSENSHSTAESEKAAEEYQSPVNPKEDEVESVPSENDTKATRTKQPTTIDKQAYFEKLMDDYQMEILEKLPPKKARTDVVLRYYHHAPDGNSAYTLETLGFYIHERPVAEEYKNYQSNAIYYGDSVAVRDIKLVGYTLLKQGLPIKVIKPSKFGDSWKARSIEIGTDTTLVDRSTIKLEDIINFER